ncbi:hypothetical protein [Desertivirga arenae]|uniref:hypothetical protein n=1 Tax=Desertivirga arenae TaxID=2810309 RepID=UPI001A9581F9|nr:hypothetical protein [Pedobacter sp. SYSU D00823]
MKSCFRLILLLLISQNLVAQSLKIESNNFSSALTKAKSENKPLCVLLIPSEKIPVPTSFVNIRKDKGITTILNKNFINFVPSDEDTIRQFIKKKYPVERTPLLLFVNGEGELFYRFFPNFKSADSLTSHFKIAAEKFREERALPWYVQEYKKGNRDTTFLKSYIKERESLGIYFNHWLAEEYAQQLPLKSVTSIPVIGFLLHTGLVYGSPLYNLITSRTSLRDSAWARFTLKERMEINSRTGFNTFTAAVKKKDRMLGMKSAEHARGLWSSKDYSYAQYIYEKELTRFYSAIKDTSQLLNHITFLIERNYLTVTTDSVKKYRALYPELKSKVEEEADERPALYNSDRSTLVLKRARAGLIARAPMELNNAAWTVYNSSTNKDLLIKALSWSKQAVKLEPLPETYDTLAHLLYKLEFYHEAEQMEIEALKLAKSSNRYTEKYKTAIEKMKSRAL